MKVCIVGLGLIGASLAWQLKAKGHTVTGIARRQETLDLAISRKVIDKGYVEVCPSALQVDLVIVALPLELIVSTILQIEGCLSAPTIVIDVGSVKTQIMKDLETRNLNKTIFVGGHPMAGSEKTGIDNFQKELFKNKPFIVCYPSIPVRLKATKIIMELVRELEARYLELSAEEHDRQVAIISHLPYLMANILFNLYLKDEKTLKQVASTGFMDTTRVAHSDPLWGAMVVLMNKQSLIPQIDAVISSLQSLKADILTIDPKALFKRFNVDHVNEDPAKIELIKKWIQEYPKA